MSLPHEAHEQVLKIDQQILHLLEQRVQLCKRGEGISPEEEEEFTAILLEDGVEKDLDEGMLEKLGKVISGVCKKAQE